MAEENAGSKPTILIVDDSEINRDVLKEIFKDDYTILEADNGCKKQNIFDSYPSGH